MLLQLLGRVRALGLGVLPDSLSVVHVLPGVGAALLRTSRPRLRRSCTHLRLGRTGERLRSGPKFQVSLSSRHRLLAGRLSVPLLVRLRLRNRVRLGHGWPPGHAARYSQKWMLLKLGVLCSLLVVCCGPPTRLRGQRVCLSHSKLLSLLCRVRRPLRTRLPLLLRPSLRVLLPG